LSPAIIHDPDAVSQKIVFIEELPKFCIFGFSFVYTSGVPFCMLYIEPLPPPMNHLPVLGL
jgi:hypothetical protein